MGFFRCLSPRRPNGNEARRVAPGVAAHVITSCRLWGQTWDCLVQYPIEEGEEDSINGDPKGPTTSIKHLIPSCGKLGPMRIREWNRSLNKPLTPWTVGLGFGREDYEGYMVKLYSPRLGPKLFTGSVGSPCFPRPIHSN